LYLNKVQLNIKEDNMTKIAFVAEDDEQTISAHFGRARQMVVVTLEDGQEIARETRQRDTSHGLHLHEHHDHDHEHDEHEGGHHHEHNPDDPRHASKWAILEDCDVVIGRGMGSPALNRLQSMGLQVYLTDLKLIDEALQAYLDGTLEHNARRVHHH
jgi:predicted Fe-Mo cluster-binding NifX family protein